jgi:hypothetical protein
MTEPMDWRRVSRKSTATSLASDTLPLRLPTRQHGSGSGLLGSGLHGLTKKLSSSQPTTSPYRRTLSRVCSNAWLGIPPPRRDFAPANRSPRFYQHPIALYRRITSQHEKHLLRPSFDPLRFSLRLRMSYAPPIGSCDISPHPELGYRRLISTRRTDC